MTQTHTPEPWVFSHDLSNTSETSQITSGPNVLVRVAAYEFYGPSIDEANANAKRIVACVNACAGITDEQLKRLTEIIDEGTAALDECGRLRHERDELLEQKDALLEALLKAFETIKDFGPGHHSYSIVSDAINKHRNT